MNNPILRILIIEDNPVDALLLKVLLEKAGQGECQVEQAGTLEGGLERVDDGRLDLILLDLGLPDSFGIETFLAIHERCPQVPVIVLTGMDDQDLATHAVKAGAQDYLFKGRLNGDQILRSSRYAIERARLLSIEQTGYALTKIAEQRFRSLVEGIDAIVWEADPITWQYSFISQRAETLLEYPIQRWMDDHEFLLKCVHPLDREQITTFREALKDGQGHQCEFRVLTASGRVVWLRDSGRLINAGQDSVEANNVEMGKAVFSGLLTDISGAMAVDQQLHQLTNFDPLTGLPNRRLFREQLGAALVQAEEYKWIVLVLFLDVDRFKAVNDSMGHIEGDELLRQVGRRLSRNLRARDTVGRIGGDEFAIILMNPEDPQNAAIVANKLYTALRQPFDLNGREVTVTASIGIAMFPDDGNTADSLIKYADTAMYAAKEAGRDTYRFYTEAMNTIAVSRLDLDNALRRAVENDEFVLRYQPKIELASGKWCGVEALLRWNRPGHGLIMPAEFIPLLEETGMIEAAGAWVIEAACKQIAAWKSSGIGSLPVAVNVSVKQLLGGRLDREVTGGRDDAGVTRESEVIVAIERALQKHAVESHLLEVELTESTLMLQAAKTVGFLQRLKALGVRISIDDFGTGYSSLAYLRRFPVDTIKIDQAFVCNITTDVDDAAIAVAIIDLAHSLKLKVIAEGVETREQLDCLRGHGCDEAQGYYIAKPMSAEDIMKQFISSGGRLSCYHEPKI
jgi:diguanylate cyclase (GGDEF)-like protein